MPAFLLRSASVIGVTGCFVAAFLWLTRSPGGDIIPPEYRGIWLDQGAACDDTDAQVRITGTTIGYDRLSFKADGLTDKGDEFVRLSGDAFPDAIAVRETVGLSLRDHRARLFILAPSLHRHGPFVRCSSGDDDA